MQVHKRRDMSEIEDTTVSQPDGLRQQFRFGDQLGRDEIPYVPELLKLLCRGDRPGSISSHIERESRRRRRRKQVQIWSH